MSPIEYTRRTTETFAKQGFPPYKWTETQIVLMDSIDETARGMPSDSIEHRLYGYQGQTAAL